MWAANGGVIACSCPGFWYRRTCKHYRAYREAVALVVAQEAVNKAWSPIPANMAAIGQFTIDTNLTPMVIDRQWST